ncbi:TetR/AcrR family transcriptional regulator [Actinocorallia sp. API 0066]|uniref:TetR/AcrR family transcriptional regulator n=1 Tax=Actinocorallia sp. API 0066 TaxID=2896846 RepID=UPI001E2FFEC1|nr:TetR/AcrR family transcriptional regulator [Actinocorallia sp. API 0066]MCD0449217.1 TetR/AcrR family transcriptional regulator [Actinocorallia sp. API 0066]
MTSTSNAGRAGTKGVPREERERQILDIATVEFGSRGYAYASLSGIAATAGVSKPLIYTYFGSRDGLHAACVHRAGTRLVEAVAAAQRVPGVANRALATLSAIFHALDGDTENWKLIYDSTLPPESDAHAVARTYQNALNTMGSEGVAAALAATTTDPTDHSLLLALWFNTITTTITWWTTHPTETPESMTTRSRRFLTALQQSPPPSPPDID